jgi:hypothetical protein
MGSVPFAYWGGTGHQLVNTYVFNRPSRGPILRLGLPCEHPPRLPVPPASLQIRRRRPRALPGTSLQTLQSTGTAHQLKIEMCCHLYLCTCIRPGKGNVTMTLTSLRMGMVVDYRGTGSPSHVPVPAKWGMQLDRPSRRDQCPRSCFTGAPTAAKTARRQEIRDSQTGGDSVPSPNSQYYW